MAGTGSPPPPRSLQCGREAATVAVTASAWAAGTRSGVPYLRWKSRGYCTGSDPEAFLKEGTQVESGRLGRHHTSGGGVRVLGISWTHRENEVMCSAAVRTTRDSLVEHVHLLESMQKLTEI